MRLANRGPMRGILFDFGGTLDYPRHWLDRFLDFYHEAGLQLDRNELDAAYSYATRLAYHDEAVRELRLRPLVRYLVDAQIAHLSETGPVSVRNALKEAGAGDRFAERIADGFVAESMRGLEYSRGVLSSLSLRFKLGVISNFYGNLDRVLAEAGIAELVSVVVDSTRVGIFKPEAGIFEVALNRLGISPPKVVMVGDSLSKDCLPARRLGLETVWLRTTDGDADDEGAADRVITDLAELDGMNW